MGNAIGVLEFTRKQQQKVVNSRRVAFHAVPSLVEGEVPQIMSISHITRFPKRHLQLGEWPR